MLFRVPSTGNVVVVEIEKANREKILRDIVKMLVRSKYPADIREPGETAT
jgi:hypothetical protein